MVIMIMEYDENQIDDDGYEQDDNADNLKMIIMFLMSWRWWWCWLCGYDDNEGGVGVVSYHSFIMVKMLSIGPVSIRNGMLRSFSFWRELILMSRIRWVLTNYNFTDPYHLCRYCILLVIDTAYVYLVVYHLVSYHYNSCLPLY